MRIYRGFLPKQDMNKQIYETISPINPNPTMHLELEEQKNANIDNNKQIFWGFNRKIQGFNNIYQ